MKLKIAFFALLLTAITGCATHQPTEYQPRSERYGYFDIQLDTNVFKVSFSRNGLTNREYAQNFALLRGAEVTLEQGFKYFQIVSVDHHTATKTGSTQISSWTNPATGQTHVYGGQAYTISRPSSSNIIMLFNEKSSSFLSMPVRFITTSVRNTISRMNNMPYTQQQIAIYKFIGKQAVALRRKPAGTISFTELGVKRPHTKW